MEPKFTFWQYCWANKMFYAGLVFFLCMAGIAFTLYSKEGDRSDLIVGWAMIGIDLIMVCAQIISYRKGPW